MAKDQEVNTTPTPSSTFHPAHANIKNEIPIIPDHEKSKYSN